MLCEPPARPAHGSIHSVQAGQASYRVGDLVRYQCSQGFMMVGSAVTACTELSSWSRPPPSCVTACTYPGTLAGARLDKVRLLYNCPTGM